MLAEFHTPALQYLRAISESDQKYYPETMNKLFIVNAPSAFVIVWKMVKGWLDPGVSIAIPIACAMKSRGKLMCPPSQTIAKIQILGKDFQGPLLNHIPAENLPKFLGGECECSHMPGGCVPSASKCFFIDKLLCQ